MFEGFSPETVDFLWGIRMNNNREWFLQNKTQYVNTLYEPMKALGKELFEIFQDSIIRRLKLVNFKQRCTGIRVCHHTTIGLGLSILRVDLSNLFKCDSICQQLCSELVQLYKNRISVIT